MRLNEATIKRIDPPQHGNKITYDEVVPGFGMRVTAKGARAFVFNYRTAGRERRLTIGSWPAWSATAARERARDLRRMVDRGTDPLGDRQQRRIAPTFGDVAHDYLERHAVHKKSGPVDAAVLKRDVLPIWGARQAEDIRRRDVNGREGREDAEAAV